MLVMPAALPVEKLLAPPPPPSVSVTRNRNLQSLPLNFGSKTVVCDT